MFGQDDNSQYQNQPNAGGSAPVPDSPLGGDPGSGNAGIPNSASQQSASPASGGFDDLLGIKQDALQQLSPLVSHLEQTPEEKFRTTMMMIQASDNQSLIKDAYECAKQITDEKARAQALLDVVNEINYFTQHNS